MFEKKRNIDSLKSFTKLETLVLDNNCISSHTKFPPLPALTTLWVNRNKITNLSTFIDKLVVSVPNLKYLSMLGNEACPNFLNGGSLSQYNDYRCVFTQKLWIIFLHFSWKILGKLENTLSVDCVI